MERNSFYQPFDSETFPEPRRRRDGEERTEFQVDRDRIIFSASFRRLQSKTQVFHSGEYDFYRTRLTHSLEVAQIGRGICQHLRQASDLLSDQFFIDGELVEACCLAHDIGHPPFGHAGESALNHAMRGHGGFEGNAQTLRILSDLIFGADGGMKPTRALLDGVLKYKRVFNGVQDTPSHFVYPDQREIVEWVGGAAEQSIECQIMDWADDVAYGLMDIVDGVHAQFITIDCLERWQQAHPLEEPQQKLMRELKDVLLKNQLERAFARRIGDCIGATSLTRRQSALSGETHRHAFALAVAPEERARIGFYKRLAVDLIFQTPQIKQLEFKGRRILTELFEMLREAYAEKANARLLPAEVELRIECGLVPTERILCDHLSAMTDAELIRTYRRLFDPQFGSIVDL
ncbi:MAG: dGTPase [Chthoniobacter sp.]|jgi:dGTPase|nr:dGTPase [Chthoniobacter sp.]